ncbi:MAG: D-alanyl-D-alanine carboxypeptidase/D-alanyl-D-alanine-endopeptidase [Firmicutes bacterium]|nr:D-alanyl-D-alanine carboxypeptidase/D-alanyl-D-alanine-endopeptidase [Bacillota bacterium]
MGLGARQGALRAGLALALAISAAGGPYVGAATPWSQVAAALGPAALPGSRVGAVFADAATGRVLFSSGAGLALPPASTLKLLVTATALADLGPGYRFRTRVFGRVDAGGTVRGDLYLVGAGDPTLTDADLERLALAVARRVRQVDGGVVVDTSLFAGGYGRGWLASDAVYGWSAVPDALTVDQGQIVAEVAPGPAVGAPARVRVWPTTAVVVLNRVSTAPTGQKDALTALRPVDGAAGIVLQGAIALDSAPVRLTVSVAHPTAWAGAMFTAYLRRAGVTVLAPPGAGTAPAGLPLLAVHTSSSLAAVLRHQNRWSINVSAEDLLRVVGVRRYGAPGTVAKGVRAERAWLASQGLSWKGTIADGCGLSLADTARAEDLVRLLVRVEHEPWAEAFVASLPVAGARGRAGGTLGEIGLFPSFHGYLRAKTGDVAAAENLAGYVRDASGRLVAFALLVDGQPYWLAGWRAEEKAVTAVAAP